MQEDLVLLKVLKALELPIGRKTEMWSDQRAIFLVRHSAFEDAKATFEVKPADVETELEVRHNEVIEIETLPKVKEIEEAIRKGVSEIPKKGKEDEE